MLKRFVFGVVAGLAFCTATAAADPVKVESENIVFYGDTSTKNAKKIVRKMEIYRKLILTLDGVTPRPDDKKLTIYAFKTVADLGSFAGRRGVAGIYTQGYDGPLMITPLRGAMRKDNFNNQVAMHEYSHHILHGYRKTAYPRWYDEGFANYLSTFHMEDGTIQLGRPAAKHAKGLFRGGPKWVDVKHVVGAIRVYPFADKGTRRGVLLNQFYAQSWLYVHYLHSDPALSKRLGDYLNRINSGEEALAAFKNGFGVSPKEFHKAARRYWYDNKFKVQQFTPKPEFMNIPMATKRISDAELALQMALGQRSFLGKKTLNSYVKKLNKYEKKNGTTEKSMAARSAYFIVNKDFSQAEILTKSAQNLYPNSLEILRVSGDLSFHRSHAGIFKDLEDNEPRIYELNDEMKKAVGYFERALQQSPDDYMSSTHMVSIYGSSDIPLTSAGRSAASTYESLYWDSNDVNGSLDLANIHMKSSETAQACEYFITAAKQADSDPKKDESSFYARVESMMDTFGDNCNYSLD